MYFLNIIRNFSGSPKRPHLTTSIIQRHLLGPVQQIRLISLMGTKLLLSIFKNRNLRDLVMEIIMRIQQCTGICPQKQI